MWLIEQRRAEGISRAAIVLAREGLAGTPALVLADAMYCSVGGLYRGHGSKVGVARAVLRYADAALCHQLNQAGFVSEKPEGYRDALRAVWSAALAYSESEPDLFAYMQLHWRHPNGSEAGVDEAGSQTSTFLHGLLTQGMSSGRLRTLPVEMVRALVWGTLVQLVKDRAAGVPCSPDQAFEALWRAIAAPHDDPSESSSRGPGRARHAREARTDERSPTGEEGRVAASSPQPEEPAALSQSRAPPGASPQGPDASESAPAARSGSEERWTWARREANPEGSSEVEPRAPRVVRRSVFLEAPLGAKTRERTRFAHRARWLLTGLMLLTCVFLYFWSWPHFSSGPAARRPGTVPPVPDGRLPIRPAPDE